MKNLGYANGWKETPPEVVACSDHNHVVDTETIGRCLTRYRCSICKIEWKVDSSD